MKANGGLSRSRKNDISDSLTVGNLHIRGMGLEGQTLEESLSDDLGGPTCGSKLPQWDLFYLSGKR